jgi:hypothetical protein
LTTGHSHDPELIAMIYDMDILWLVMALADSAFYVRYQMFDEKVFAQPVINAHGFILPSKYSWHLTPKSPAAV